MNKEDTKAKNDNKIDFAKVIIENGFIISVFYIFLLINSFFYQYGKLYYYGLHSRFIKVDLLYDIPELIVSIVIIALIFCIVLLVRHSTIKQYVLIDKIRILKKITEETELLKDKLSKDVDVTEKGIKRTIPVIVALCGLLLLFFISILLLLDTDVIAIVMLSAGIICLCLCVMMYKKNIIYLIFACFFAFTLTAHTNFLLGHFISSRTAGYYIANEHDNKVIVYQDAEKLILMPYVQDDNILKRNYSIISYDNLGDIIYCVFENPVRVEDK